MIFVTVGTDHHRFDRLMDWIEEWAAGPGAGVPCVVQHGSSRAPRGVEAHAFLPHERVQELFRRSAAVVSQGGPGSIIESRTAGRKPIVVPRLPELDEVVDDHQVRFSRHLARLGDIGLAENRLALFAHLRQALKNPGWYTASHDAAAAHEAVSRFGELVAELVSPSRSARARS
ncbi:glycosyltransferase [Nonomuraea soli]|uniref:UDP-N-acetylglucosamine transferase subunit ALG13 n=1 Tax=Nonomuraea soli TaxID=1032476 RepID=A0A7W0CVE0_9ACTN|nr:glycosyltransferase [Nonomuraea soli]MBA2897975.1 UDP-N-acetylglucosamine transferase subunit ALG13 [Nonomuraea soli]